MAVDRYTTVQRILVPVQKCSRPLWHCAMNLDKCEYMTMDHCTVVLRAWVTKEMPVDCKLRVLLFIY